MTFRICTSTLCALLILPGLMCLSGAALAAASPSPTSVSSADAPLLEGRAAQAAIWGMPVVNYDLMRQQMLTKTAGKENQFIFWGRPLDWHNQTLTPNPDTIYFMTFMNTKDVGPIVLEIPPADETGSLNANIVNIWQAPLEDAGLLGIDKGKGLKLLIVPPGQNGPWPTGYEVLDPGTYGSYALVRANMKSHDPTDVWRSIAYAKHVRVYPLSKAGNQPETVFTDVQNVDFDSTIRYDDSFFNNLNRILQYEPWLDRDRVMIDPLRSLGIEKGQPYAPSAEVRKAMTAGIHDAQKYLVARYDQGFPTFYDGTHWMMPTDPSLIKAAQNDFNAPDDYPVYVRGLAYSYAYIGLKRLGAGQFYLINIKDKQGASFDGAKTYHQHVPANVPVE